MHQRDQRLARHKGVVGMAQVLGQRRAQGASLAHQPEAQRIRGRIAQRFGTQQTAALYGMHMGLQCNSRVCHPAGGRLVARAFELQEGLDVLLDRDAPAVNVEIADDVADAEILDT